MYVVGRKGSMKNNLQPNISKSHKVVESHNRPRRKRTGQIKVEAVCAQTILLF